MSYHFSSNDLKDHEFVAVVGDLLCSGRAGIVSIFKEVNEKRTVFSAGGNLQLENFDINNKLYRGSVWWSSTELISFHIESQNDQT